MWRLPVCVLLLCSGTVAFDFDDEEIAVTDGGAPGAAGSTEHAGAVGKSVELEHRLGDGPLASRGKLFYRYISGVGGLVASARVSQAKLSGDELSRFEQLVSSGGYYTLRLPSSLDGEGDGTVFASVSVCALLASRFEEHIHLTMGTNGQLLALSYTVPINPSRCPTTGLPRMVLDEILYNTTVTVEFPPEGPKPFGKVPDAGFLPAATAAALAARASRDGKPGMGPDGQPAPPKSFLQKYWMYLLPIALIMVSGGGEPPAAAADGDGAAAAGGAGAARGGKKRA